MKRMLLPVILLSLLVIGCEKDEPVILKSAGGFPLEPVNLSICNSKYDDYNPTIAAPQGDNDFLTFVFSSNRNSKGKDFDFIMYTLSLNYPIEKNEVILQEFDGMSNRGGFVDYYLSSVNTVNNELGPFMMDYNKQTRLEDYLFFYTREAEERCNLYFYKMEYGQNPVYTDYIVSILNTDLYNVGYLTIPDNKLYYNCDKDGTYDIYELEIDTTMDLVDFLTQPAILPSKAKKIASSDAEDKCPFVAGDFMVFTSNRVGGQGGYDLWYSKRTNGEWSEPVNFGPSVNSSSAEYRPVVRKYKGIPNDMMVFSSNRSGGHGGFDLYYVGISQTKE